MSDPTSAGLGWNPGTADLAPRTCSSAAKANCNSTIPWTPTFMHALACSAAGCHTSRHNDVVDFVHGQLQRAGVIRSPADGVKEPRIFPDDPITGAPHRHRPDIILYQFPQSTLDKLKLKNTFSATYDGAHSQNVVLMFDVFFTDMSGESISFTTPSPIAQSPHASITNPATASAIADTPVTPLNPLSPPPSSPPLLTSRARSTAFDCNSFPFNIEELSLAKQRNVKYSKYSQLAQLYSRTHGVNVVFMPLHFDPLGWMSKDTSDFLQYIFNAEKSRGSNEAPERNSIDHLWTDPDPIVSKRWRELSTLIVNSTCTSALFNLRHSSLSKSTATVARTSLQSSPLTAPPTPLSPRLTLPPLIPLISYPSLESPIPLSSIIPTLSHPDSHLYHLPGALPTSSAVPRASTRMSKPNPRYPRDIDSTDDNGTH